MSFGRVVNTPVVWIAAGPRPRSLARDGCGWVLAALVLAGCNGAGGDGDASTAETTDDDGVPGEILDAPIEVIRYEQQPMVVDLRLTLSRDATAELVHLSDSGVRAEVLSGGEPLSPTIRVRGLRPDASHALELTLTDDTNIQEVVAVDFVTLPPLEGFVPQYLVEGGTNADPSYRLFDQVALDGSRSSITLVDTLGTTRWYWTRPGAGNNIIQSSAGIRLRPDGRVSFVSLRDLWVLDELGEATRVDSTDLWPGGFHHDVVELPSGHFVALGYDFREVQTNQGTERLVGDALVEFDLEGNLYWEWSTFDYLDVNRRRDGFDILVHSPIDNLEYADWTHANALVYDETRDHFVVSLRHQDWLLGVDHASGNLLWRAGEEGDFALNGDRWFYHQHAPEWQPDGTLMLYDNGNGNPNLANPDEVSRVLVLDVDTEQMQITVVDQSQPQSYLSAAGSDADLMPSGHVLRTDSLVVGSPSAPSQMTEYDPARGWAQLWKIVSSPGNFWYRGVPTDRFVGERAE